MRRQIFAVDTEDSRRMLVQDKLRHHPISATGFGIHLQMLPVTGSMV